MYHSVGKAVYLTATLPYVLLLALTARALTMEGAHEGVRHLFYPDWSLLLNAEVPAQSELFYWTLVPSGLIATIF